MSKTKLPLVLILLDGWGHREESSHNAIHHANTPAWDKLWGDSPHTVIEASGADVGLPANQMGNSEVGHINIGSGRVVYQEFTRISRSIRTGSFFTNQTLTQGVDKAINSNKNIHIIGLLSPGGVHSHEDHIIAMVRLAAERGAKNIYLHAFLDGRDTAPKSAEPSLKKAQAIFDETGCGQIASIIGRYYAMDRDHRWPRIQQAYDLITQGKAEFSNTSALAALDIAYQRGETDEFIKATAILKEGKAIRIEDGDMLFFMNYRSDRARQITRPFIEKDFDGFERDYVPAINEFVCLTEYKSDFHAPVAFPPSRLKNVLGEVLSKRGVPQLRLAETEKYAHVTFFFNGGREDPFEWEDRILVPSPQVRTYDLQPEMSAAEVTDHLVQAIKGKKYDVIICNFANTDMVGHTGKFDATVKAVEAVDRCLGEIVSAVKQHGGELLITADHGNAELMQKEGHDQPHTAHTCCLVPLVYMGRPCTIKASGVLADIAPTMLYLLDIKVPGEMTGQSLLDLS